MTDSDIPAQRDPSLPGYAPHPTIPGATTPVDLPPQQFPAVRIATKRQTPVPTVILFYLDDVPYPIPSKVPASYVVAFLNDLRSVSEGAAISRMMTRLLGGETAMQDLQKAEGLEMEQLEEILNTVRKMSIAATRKATGK